MRIRTFFPGHERRRLLRDLLITICMLAAAVGICLILGRVDSVEHGDAYVSMVFILAVLLVSYLTDGYLFGAAASLVSVLAVNYFFTFPYFEFNFSLPGYPITITCMLTVSMLTCTLTGRIKQQQEARREAEKEKLRGNLLRAMSHDLRTPLTSILGANSVLMERGGALDEAQRLRLHQEIGDDAQWLIRMVENLLSVTKIREDSATKLKKTSEIVEEVVAEAVAKLHKRYPEQSISVQVPEEPITCPMDALLIEQVLLNLLENAVQHAGRSIHIGLTATQDAEQTVFSVSDDGRGVSREQLAHFFDEAGMSVSETDGRRGMGIGLSVCNTIIHAHGGQMHADGRTGGGLTVSFTLPSEEGAA